MPSARRGVLVGHWAQDGHVPAPAIRARPGLLPAGAGSPWPATTGGVRAGRGRHGELGAIGRDPQRCWSDCSTPAAATTASPISSGCRRGRPDQASWPTWAPDDAGRRGGSSSGSPTPWTHQLDAAEHAHAGRSVVLATGTGSGKSLAFLLPGPHRRAGRAGGGRRPRRHRALPRADQGAGRRPGPGAARARRPGRTGRRVRRRHPDGGARLGPPVRRVRPDQPRHAARRDPARARAVGAVPQVAAVRRDRRGARLPRGVRRARRPGDPPAAPHLRVVRQRAGLRARVGHDRRAGRDRRAPGRPAGRRGDRGRVAARRDRVRALGAAGGLGARRARRAAAPQRRSPRWPSCSATSCSRTPRPWRSCARGARPRRSPAAVRERLARTRPDLAARVAAYRGGYLAGGAARPRARAARPPAARAGVDERARARRGHRRARRRPPGRLPGQPRVGVAAGRPGRPGRRPGARGAGRAGRPAGQLPRAPPGGAVRRSRSRRPCSTRTTRTSSPRTSPRRRPSCRCRTRDLELFGPAAPDAVDGAHPGRAAAPAADRLVLDQPRPGHRPGRPARLRRRHGPRRRGSAPDGCSARSTRAARTGRVHEGAVYVHQGGTYLVESLDLDDLAAVVVAAEPGLHDVRPGGERPARAVGARPGGLGAGDGPPRRGRGDRPGRVVRPASGADR